MILKSLSLIDFRNYEKLEWHPHHGINVITGPNANGKTNLLEAIYFSGIGCSFRGRERDMVRWGTARSSVRASYHLNNITIDVIADVQTDGKKNYRIDGIDHNRKSLPGRFGIISFRPDDLQIIKGSPSSRRNFLDDEIGFLDPIYRHSLLQYRRVVTQRNNLLRQAGVSKDLIRVWDDQFYRYGADVLSRRIKILKHYTPLVRHMYKVISGGEELEIKYLSTVTVTGGTTAKEIYNDFIIEGKTRENEEFNKRQTVFGPHRDEVLFLLDNKDIRQFGSQGQIRSAVLALKTAQVRLFQRETSEKPILLLDDVLMELDKKRQQYIINIVSEDMQTFITTTGLSGYTGGRVDRVYSVGGGTLKEDI